MVVLCIPRLCKILAFVVSRLMQRSYGIQRQPLDIILVVAFLFVKLPCKSQVTGGFFFRLSGYWRNLVKERLDEELESGAETKPATEASEKAETGTSSKEGGKGSG